MSAQIQKERKAYYQCLETTQKGDLDVTKWIVWFLDCLDRAIEYAEDLLSAVFAKANFWDAYSDVPMNERQKAMLNKLLDGFSGNLTTSKWAKITKVSSDTALRDIKDLIEKNILTANSPAGRSTNYSLKNTD
jgi:Fic family protein